jgi:hypothetical protein
MYQEGVRLPVVSHPLRGLSHMDIDAHLLDRVLRWKTYFVRSVGLVVVALQMAGHLAQAIVLMTWLLNWAKRRPATTETERIPNPGKGNNKWVHNP